MVFRRVNRCYKNTTQEFNFFLDLFTLLNSLCYHHPSPKCNSLIFFFLPKHLFSAFFFFLRSRAFLKMKYLTECQAETDDRGAGWVAGRGRGYMQAESGRPHLVLLLLGPQIKLSRSLGLLGTQFKNHCPKASMWNKNYVYNISYRHNVFYLFI